MLFIMCANFFYWANDYYRNFLNGTFHLAFFPTFWLTTSKVFNCGMVLVLFFLFHLCVAAAQDPTQ